jgi:3'5'-cyclic nucleotide phosphodiesterase
MLYYLRTAGAKEACNLSDFEEFTAYLAAGIHDVHHQGLRNDYEAKTGSTKAIVYSD